VVIPKVLQIRVRVSGGVRVRVRVCSHKSILLDQSSLRLQVQNLFYLVEFLGSSG